MSKATTYREDWAEYESYLESIGHDRYSDTAPEVTVDQVQTHIDAGLAEICNGCPAQTAENKAALCDECCIFQMLLDRPLLY